MSEPTPCRMCGEPSYPGDLGFDAEGGPFCSNVCAGRYSPDAADPYGLEYVIPGYCKPKGLAPAEVRASSTDVERSGVDRACPGPTSSDPWYAEMAIRAGRDV